MPTIGFVVGSSLGAVEVPPAEGQDSSAPDLTTADPVRDFLLEDDLEIAVRNGDFDVARGKAAVPQGIRCRLSMLLEECFLDQTKGTDWVGQILVKNPNVNITRELILEQLLDTPDVTDAVVIDVINIGNRRARIPAKVATIYSNTPFAAEITGVA